MTTIDFSPLYRNTVGFDRLASLINNTLSADRGNTPGYPPYNIESLEDNRYSVTLAVAGFSEDNLDINIEKGVLTVRGKQSEQTNREYLYQGIANRSFERKFNLADYVEVTGADLNNGLLTINLVKEIPEAMKPRSIAISNNSSSNSNSQAIEHQEKAASNQVA